MKDYYEMIGTSENAIRRKKIELIKSRKLTDEQANKLIDQFIREKYEDTIKLIRMKKSLCKDDLLRIKILELQENRITDAYEQVSSQILRELYSFDKRERERQTKQKPETKIVSKKNNLQDYKITKEGKNIDINRTAYNILGTFEETMKKYSEKENDKRIREKAKKLLKSYIKELKGTDDFKIRLRLQIMIKEIKDSYELVKTGERRKEYNEMLQRERRERNIKKKYSHAEEYDLGLIASSKKSEKQILWNKMVGRLDKNGNEYIYEDEEGREIGIKKTGEVIYVNGGGGRMSIDEYEITRIVDGEEIKDIIYTDTIKHILLSRDKETGMPIDPKYYNCVVNELLSEEAIEGSKYNGGYIGKICKDKEGNYHTTLCDEELSQSEKENLTAVMIMQKINEIKSEKYEEKGAQK